MIYSEAITTDLVETVLGRQRDEPEDKWYGIRFEFKDYTGNDVICDNDSWVAWLLYPRLLDKEYAFLRHDLNVKWNNKVFKEIRKAFKEANRLGWFDDIEPYPIID